MKFRSAMLTILLVVGLLAASIGAAAAPSERGQRGRGPTGASTQSVAQETGNLLVVVNATGTDGAFAIQGSGAGGLPSSFTVQTDNGSGEASFRVSGNRTYGLAPQVPAGWSLDASACDNGTPANVTVATNATTTCWFDFTRLAKLVLAQTSVGGDGTFAYNLSGPEGNATLAIATANGTGSATAWLAPGVSYSLWPIPASGWNATAPSCEGRELGNLTLASNETVTCALRAERLNSITVRVNAAGGDAAFPFNGTGGGIPEWFSVQTTNGSASTTFTDLQTNATYGIVPLPITGWKHTGSYCWGDSPANLTLDAGEAIECVFNYTRLATIVVNVRSIGGNGTFDVNATGPGMPPAFTLTTVDGAASARFETVEPGSAYSLAVTAPSGWRLTSSACSAGSPANVTLAPNASADCWFNLTRLAEVRGVVFEDASGDGVRNASEIGLSGWTVFVDVDQDAAWDADEPSAATNATGVYALGGVSPGERVVRLVLQTNWTATNGLARSLNLSDGAVAEADFGVARASRPATPPANGTAAGPGFWKNWNSHKTYDAATLDAWLRDVAASSKWLGANTTSEMVTLLTDATKQCNKRFGKEGCAQVKFGAAYLVLRLNVASGRVTDAGDVIAELEAQHGVASTREDFQSLRQQAQQAWA